MVMRVGNIGKTPSPHPKMPKLKRCRDSSSHNKGVVTLIGKGRRVRALFEGVGWLFDTKNKNDRRKN